MSKLIVLGITGSISAYKGAELCRNLIKRGYAVQVVMTANAMKFIAPLTFQTLTRRAVVTSLWEEGDWKPEHVALADEANLFAVAPATANFIAKFACGIADDALSSFAATFAGPTVVSPAMNPKMWLNPACQANVKTLKERGIEFCGPETGEVACGADGAGRLAAVDRIADFIASRL